MPFFLSTRTEILDELSIRVRDTADSRYTEPEKVYAINGAIRKWANRVLVPFTTTLSTGFTSSSFTVQVPAYVNPRWMRPQIETSALDYYDIPASVDTWVDLPSYTVEPDGSGGHLIRSEGYLYTSDVRIIHWAAPGPVPITTSASDPVVLVDSTTSMTVTTATNRLSECGFIKVNSEWIQYSGIADAGSTLTLSNLVRGVMGTTTATHDADDVVDWGVPMDRIDLLEQLFSQAEATLHQMFITYANETESSKHQFAMRYAQQMADEYWKSYSSSYDPKLILDFS